ncbi:hypothetical protein CHS0354_001148 [Potamilus streckersoni]|uniref:Uncharacterized protein n=1 Tax=Potamilus streckersoni TaxID=2493646 RepID=A0AAE0RMA5_9BIVA|nr:hypothetical protein CHS0354_001148 [Potamilus streckersoni]
MVSSWLHSLHYPIVLGALLLSFTFFFSKRHKFMETELTEVREKNQTEFVRQKLLMDEALKDVKEKTGKRV